MNISQAFKKRGVHVLTSIFESVKMHTPPDIETAQKYIADLIDEVIQYKAESMFDMIPFSDIVDYPIVHSVNVSLLSVIFGFKLKMKPEELSDIGLGALLHDMGKINMSDDILWKQDWENEYERKTLTEHTIFGAHWLSNNGLINENVLKIIKSHHENFIGNGYPESIPDRELSQAVRIVALCNYYHYLISDFPDKPALPPRDAFFEMSQLSGKRFNPKLVSSFLNDMGPMLLDGPLFQKTMLVLLDTKEVAAVMKVESYGDTQPEIIILTNAQGVKLPRPLTINMRKDSSRKIVKILKT
jgi:HD-GYP domain-containing protein (c-di-GMP phosphodiesterase class II)